MSATQTHFSYKKNDNEDKEAPKERKRGRCRKDKADGRCPRKEKKDRRKYMITLEQVENEAEVFWNAIMGKITPPPPWVLSSSLERDE